MNSISNCSHQLVFVFVLLPVCVLTISGASDLFQISNPIPSNNGRLHPSLLPPSPTHIHLPQFPASDPHQRTRIRPTIPDPNPNRNQRHSPPLHRANNHSLRPHTHLLRTNHHPHKPDLDPCWSCRCVRRRQWL